MASATRASSFLPSIKCSNCNAEIPISLMGDHVCSLAFVAPPVLETRLRALDGPLTSSTSKLTMGPPLSKPNRTAAPQLKPIAATLDKLSQSNRPIHSQSIASSSRSASPSGIRTGRKSPYQTLSRSATTPLPVGPPSPDFSIAQDCAFPPFPTSKSRSTTPTTPSDTTFSFPSIKGKPQGQTEADTAPLSPRVIGGGSVMQRMNSIAPGPFNLREKGNTRPSGHIKSPSLSSSQDFIRPSSSGTAKSHFQRPSTSGSNYPRNPSLSSSSGGAWNSFSRHEPDVPTIPNLPVMSTAARPSIQDVSTTTANTPQPIESSPTIPTLSSPRKTSQRDKPATTTNKSQPIDLSPTIPNSSPPRRPSQQDNPATTANKPQSAESAFDFGSFGQENRSHTFPQDNHDLTQREDQAIDRRRPSEPSVRTHKPRPSLAAAMQPLHEIGSTSSFKSSRSLRSRTVSPSMDRKAAPTPKGIDSNETRDDRRLENAPPVPMPVKVSSVASGNPYHTPHESTSSNESYSSSAKTGSSRSSPPLNDSPKRQSQHTSDGSQLSNPFNGFQFGVENTLAMEEPAPFRDGPQLILETPNYTRLRNTQVTVPPAKPSQGPLGEAPVLHSPPATSPDEYFVSSHGSQSSNVHLSPTPPTIPRPPSSPARRPTTAHKGNCRGCGELIKGKSVSSADGRLTGRYHKQCFVCKTCNEPFQTADFYVMNNHPYCGRHYHELNGSLCTTCDRGIEGQYLETELKQKFHPHCFSCRECHRILRDDYFEWNGRTLCEQHAFRAVQQPSLLGPGRKFPERRTTRLMMM